MQVVLRGHIVPEAEFAACLPDPSLTLYILARDPTEDLKHMLLSDKLSSITFFLTIKI